MKALSKRRRNHAAVTLALVLLAAACQPGPDDNRRGGGSVDEGTSVRLDAAHRRFATNDVIERACALPPKQLIRIWRGVYRPTSEDLIIVPQEPNYPGSFQAPNHSGPWHYLQNVPLVLYGPGHIRSAGRVDADAGLVDLYATVGRIVGAGLHEREGRVLDEALVAGADPPKLVVTVVWDGIGRNVLDLWPDSWPNLRRLERVGTSFTNATVGSSPSITPATHATLGTGAFPRSTHETGIDIELDGAITQAFEGNDPSGLARTTYADDIDRHFDNASKVGMIAWSPWHLGMLGHGLGAQGGDADQLGLIGIDRHLVGNPTYYETPPYLEYFPGFDAHADEVDRADGRADGKWLGHDMTEENDNPAYVAFGTDVILSMLRREGYGTDGVPDLFFTNYKMSDLVGHRFYIDSREEEEVLRAQDRALGRIADFLDEEVGDYVLLVTADHGHTPTYKDSGGWPVAQGQIKIDIDGHFGAPEGRSFIEETTAVGSFLDHDLMRSQGVTADEMATFLNGYTLADNFGGKTLPQGFTERGDESLLSAAFPASRLGDIMRCAFGQARPPSGARA